MDGEGGIEGAQQRARPPWRRRLLIVGLVVLLFGAGFGVRATLLRAERADEAAAAAWSASAGSRAIAWATDDQVTSDALALANAEAEANEAALAVSEARARLAETGVDEAELRTELAEAQRRVDEAEKRRTDLAAEISTRSALLPDVDGCLMAAIRSLSVKARNPTLTLSPASGCGRPETGAT